MNKKLKNLILTVLPSKLFLDIVVYRNGYFEPELELIPLLCDKSFISIDIGADEGLYLAHMYRRSKMCYGFEPRITAVKYLRKLFSGITPIVQIENVALSNKSGTAELRIPKEAQQESTLEINNKIEHLGEIEIENIPIKKLDDYKIESKVGFIKIDVEGHEEAVLQGAICLLQRDHPSLLIEIEERHQQNSISEITNYLNGLGYQGYFYHDKHLKKIELFDKDLYQNYELKDKIYIYNFIYISEENIHKFNNLF